jgi:4-amino-4-deoxy-L-arabinose transferase-like glycosyltransferase
MAFIKKHLDIFTILGLFVAFYFLFFHNIWAYPLMDVDETRYVAMSRDMFHTKDFLTLYLNGDFFFEKPPLYFWGECLSFGLFKHINEFTARIPMAVYASLSCFLLYFTGKKIVSISFGVISALILGTSIEFLVLSKIAILDMLLATCVAFSLYFGFMTFFAAEKNKKYFWWLFYAFSGIAVLAKGIPAVAIPFGTMFFAGLVSKKIKDFFRPQYFLVGTVLFFAIALPWHLIMFKMHDPLFFNEYIMKHHLSRFIDSKDLGRQEPWYYFILMMTWGLIPWIASFTAMLMESIEKINLQFFKNFSFEKMTDTQKFITLNSIAFLFILLFFSSSSTKLMTYILPIYAPTAVLLAWWWGEYIFENKHQKSIKISIYIFNSILILVAIVAAFSGLYLPTELTADIASTKWFLVALLSIVPLVGIIFAVTNKKIGVFASYVAFILILSAFGTHQIFNVDYKFGQNDLMEYAKFAKENKFELSTFKFGRRYSLLYYYEDKVKFQQEEDYAWLNKTLNKHSSVVVIKNKEIETIRQNTEFKVIKTGRKYSLIKR